MYNKNGVTLIELIVVLAIISILMTVAVPLYSMIGEFYLDTSSKELLVDMRLAQQKAMTEGYYYHIYFNSSNNSYMIYSYKDMNSCVYKKVNLPAGIKFDRIHSTYEENKISFDERGKPYPRPCTVALKDSGGHYKRITITVATDYISLKKD